MGATSHPRCQQPQSPLPAPAPNMVCWGVCTAWFVQLLTLCLVATSPVPDTCFGGNEEVGGREEKPGPRSAPGPRGSAPAGVGPHPGVQPAAGGGPDREPATAQVSPTFRRGQLGCRDPEGKPILSQLLSLSPVEDAKGMPPVLAWTGSREDAQFPTRQPPELLSLARYTMWLLVRRGSPRGLESGPPPGQGKAVQRISIIQF